jgi:hypothetical protein
MTQRQNPHRWHHLGLKLLIGLVLASVFAWYFLGPVPFDLDRLWAFCTGN